MSKRIDAIAVTLAEWVIGHRWPVLSLCIALMVLAGSGGRFLEFSNNYRVFFGKDNPELLAFEDFQTTYTKNDNIIFVIQPSDGQVFSPRIAEAIEQITERAWKIPYAIRVDSITNFQHSWADGDDLTVEDLIRNGRALSAEELEHKKVVALAEPLLRGNLISDDADTTGINVTLQYPEKRLEEVPEAVAVARRIVAEMSNIYPDVTFALSGLSMLNNAFAESGQKDLQTLVPLMYAVLILIMVLTLRSFSGSVATLVVIGFSSITAVGLAGFVGIKLTPISAVAPTIILTLAIADSIHILITMQKKMRHGLTKSSALVESIRVNLIPVTITSLTTIVGFLGLNFSDTPPFWDLGNITAMGIAAAWFYSLMLLPAVASLLPFRARYVNGRETAGVQGIINRFADFVTRYYRLVGWGATVLVLAALLLIPRIELNDEWIKYFDHRMQFRNDAEFTMEHLNGIYQVEFSVGAGEEGGISNPAYLRHLDTFTSWLRAQEETTHVYSYADIVRRLNRNMHGDDPMWNRIPEDRQLAAQYLLLYELSLPFGLDLNDRINVDKSATRVTVSLPEISTVRMRDFINRSRNWLEENTPTYMHAEPTSASVMFSYISERNIHSMLRGNAMALGLIALIMVFTLRSWKLGMLSLIPNTLPIAVTFGLWALFVGKVGMAAATVTSTSLGIIVDDTVHFLAKYIRARREDGLSSPEAVKAAFDTVGKAIVVTTAILTLGFSVLATSTFAINSQMGLMTAMAMVVALILTSRFCLYCWSWDIRRKENIMKLVYHKTRSRSRFNLVWATLLLAGGSAVAETSEEKGYAIAARSDRSDRGFANSTVELKMVLRNKAGKQTTRTLSIRTLEIPDENVGDKSLIVFDTPADIKGTALLSHAKILDPDDQWLYLPALKRIKRISSVNKSGPFVGSEFAFEDFTALELNKYTYRYMREETLDGLTCDVVERVPRLRALRLHQASELGGPRCLSGS